MKLRNFFAALLLLSLVTPKTALCAQDATALLMPKPQQMTENGATFDLGRPVTLTDPTNSTLLASLFTTSGTASASVTVNIVSAATLGTFDYTLAGFDNEGYQLNVTADAITINAATKTGVIRAAQTLMQLAAAMDGASIPGVSITDYPAFKLRGFMHDVGRSFISFDELKKEIDLLSRFKVNVFHWHLTDNQGFRFESKTYPQLNAASAMTRFAGSYYTQAQCTELEAYAAERGMIIIPEIDMPGHSQAFQTAMGFAMNSDEGKPVLKALLSELAAAFPLAPYIHMGADEAGTTAAFVNEMSQYIKETLHRKCIVWNPISGVTISKANLPYIDMTEMWSTSGRKIDGLPNIDCRYNYVNHFDIFADLVGIYKSNVYYAQQGNSEVAGAITAIWNDRKTATETDIISQNGLYAHALATAERGWMGGGNQYIEVGGTTLPNSGSEFEAFADWERRFLHYKDTWLADEPIPYVKQTNVKWRVTQAFPNGGTASAVFPPETATDDILPDQFTYDGQTYTTSIATGAGIYLRHVWGTTVPAFYSNPQLNTTAYAWTYVYSPTAQTAGALIEFQNYSRSENDKAPDAGNWDRKGSRIWVNGTEVTAPTWTNSGKNINSEVDLGNENFPAREPISISLHAGWNKVLLKLPYVSASNIRLNKWMFTFVLTDATGRHALDGITYSPIQSLDSNINGVVTTIGDIKTYVNSKCGTAVGVYPRSAASSLLAEVETVEATLQETLTAAEREAQVSTLTSAFETFKTSLASAAINQPTAYTSAEPHYYTLCTPQRGTRYVTSSGAGAELGGHPTLSAEGCWKFVSRGDGTWNIVNVVDASYIAPNSTYNTALSTSATQPSAGWTIGKAATDGQVTITSDTCQFNQTNTASSMLSGGYRLYNWGGGTNTTDTGCQYLIAEIDEDDIPFTLSTTALDEFADKDISVGTTAATSLSIGQWYIMKNMGRNSYLYEKASDHKLYTQSTQPTGEADGNAQFLVRLIDDGNGGYYLQTGYGNYFYTLVDGNDGSGVGGNNNGTKAFMKTAYTIGTIASGYFWLKDAKGVVMDANTAGSTVAGWGTTAPTSTTSNAAWQFFAVTLNDAWAPNANEVYTLNNTQSDNRGALVYDGTSTNVGLVASASLDATNPNHQWVVYPTETEGEYYLFNVGAGKFAIPTGIAESPSNSWVFSDNAVAVTLTSETAGTYRIKMAKDPVSGTNAAVLGVNRDLNPAVFNYNDAGSDFTFTRVEGADASAAATAAVSKLISSQTALATYPQASGWYAIQIKSKNNAASYAGRFMQNATSLYSGLYPLTFTGAIDVQPAVTDPTFFTYISHTSWDVNTWQLPDGRFLVDNGSNKFPTPSTTAGNVKCGYSNGNYFKTNGNYYADPYNNNANYFIGETTTMRTAYTIYPIDLDAAGLVAWQALCDNAPESAQITCSRSDVCGLTSVYKNGFFFLPTGVTPESTDFNLDGATNVTVDATDKTVTFTYDPSLAIVADGVTVEQGWQTAGRDSEVMLLKVTAKPFKDATNTTLTVNLKDGSEANISTLKLYEANNNSPEIYSTGDGAPTKTEVATASISGSTATFNIGNLTAGTHYYWIGATVSSTATLGAVLDAAVTGIAYQVAGQTAQNLDLTSVGDPADRGAMVFNVRSYPFLPRDNGSRVYRIPSMIVADDGSIVVAADKRYQSHTDIGNGHVIDIVVRRSTDGGKTWSSPVVIAKGLGSADNAKCGYGDPSLVKGKDGKLYCLFVAGNLGYFYGQQRIAMSTSTDNGVTWSSNESTAPIDLLESGRLKNYNTVGNAGYGLYDYFVTSGRGLYIPDDDILMYLIPAQTMTSATEHTSNSQDYIFYSRDGGESWYFSPQTMFAGGDEAKIILMNDGSLLGSVRQGYNRGFNTATYTKNDDGKTLNFTFGSQWNNSQLSAGGYANNQDIFYYQRATETGKTDVIFHSMTTGQHANFKLYYSTDGGANWTEFLNVQTKGTRYVTMDKNPANGSLYLLFEDQSLNSAGGYTDYNHYPLNFLEITRDQLVALIPALEEYNVPEYLKTSVVKNTVYQTSTGCDSYGAFSGTGSGHWARTWTSNASSGVAGLTISTESGYGFDKATILGTRVMTIRPSANGATDTYTITAPAGYVISSYTIGGAVYTGGTYRITAADGTTTGDITSTTTPTNINVTDVNASSTTFTFYGASQNNWFAFTNFTITLAKTLPLNVVGDKSYATLYLPFDVTTTGATKAYYIETTNNGYAQLTATDNEGTKIPANTAVVLINSDADASTVLNMTTGLSTVVIEIANLLKGTLVSMSLDLSDETPYYSLGQLDGTIGFYKFDDGEGTANSKKITLAANKAYLDTTAPSSPVKGFLFDLGGADAIDTVQGSGFKVQDSEIFNLAGQRLNKPMKGVNIINGRKVLVK